MRLMLCVAEFEEARGDVGWAKTDSEAGGVAWLFRVGWMDFEAGAAALEGAVGG